MTDDLFGHGAVTDEDIDRLSRDLAGEEFSHAWPDTLAELVDVFTAHFASRGVEEATAAAEARAVAIRLAKHFGGRAVYLPNGKNMETALRDDEIYRRVGRETVDQLARYYRLSQTQIYDIIARQRKLRVSRTQGRLF